MGLDPAATAVFSRVIADLVTRLETPPRDDVFNSARSIVIGAIETPRLLAFQAFYLVLELEDRPTTEASLRESLRRITRGSTPGDGEAPDDREFQSEKRRVDSTDYTVHSLALIPGFHLSYVRVGDRYVVSTSDAALSEAVRASSDVERPSSRSGPSRACKVLFLRPEAIVRMTMGTALSEDATLVILSEVKRALFYTRERPDGVSLELEMPDLTPTLRAILQRLARILQGESSGTSDPDG